MEIISQETARSRGLTRFFTGNSCRNGHVAEFNTNTGRCCECTRNSQLKSYAKHGNSYKAKKRKDYKPKTHVVAVAAAASEPTQKIKIPKVSKSKHSVVSRTARQIIEDRNLDRALEEAFTL